MTTLPLPVNEVLNILNLPADLGENQIFLEHSSLVLSQIADYISADDYASLTTDDPEEEPSAALQTAARFAFAFLLLASTCEFLNLKTIGEGIVKTIGLDASATQLLTGAEIEDFRRRLVCRALTPLRDWLNEDGLAALGTSESTPSRRFRVALI